MADHIRRQLREAVATAITGLTTTGARVFQSRVYPVQNAELPGLLVYVTEEEVENSELDAPFRYRRDMSVQVVGMAKAAADLDDVLDQIGKEVETALASALTVGSTAQLLELSRVEISFDAESEKPVGEISMTYRATLFSVANAPDVAIG